MVLFSTAVWKTERESEANIWPKVYTVYGTKGDIGAVSFQAPSPLSANKHEYSIIFIPWNCSKFSTYSNCKMHEKDGLEVGTLCKQSHSPSPLHNTEVWVGRLFLICHWDDEYVDRVSLCQQEHVLTMSWNLELQLNMISSSMPWRGLPSSGTSGKKLHSTILYTVIHLRRSWVWRWLSHKILHRELFYWSRELPDQLANVFYFHRHCCFFWVSRHSLHPLSSDTRPLSPGGIDAWYILRAN